MNEWMYGRIWTETEKWKIGHSYNGLISDLNRIEQIIRCIIGQGYNGTYRRMNGQIWIETEKQKIGQSYFGLVSDLNKS